MSIGQARTEKTISFGYTKRFVSIILRLGPKNLELLHSREAEKQRSREELKKKEALDTGLQASTIGLVGCTDATNPLWQDRQTFQEIQMLSFNFPKRVNVPTGKFNKDGKEIKERKVVGMLPVLIPDFNDILTAMMADTADVLKKSEKGEPIANCFVSPEVQFIFDAVAEKTKARFSEFVMDDGSLSSKYVPWTSLLDLSDPAFARNIAEEFAGLLKAHILALGKSQGLADKLALRITPVSTDVLKTDAPSNKGLVSKYVASTFESLSEEQQARFEARVTSLIEAVESEPELLSDD